MFTKDQIQHINSLIGKPWSLNGYGPDEFGCWGLSVHIQQKLFNRLLPQIHVAEAGDKSVDSRYRMYSRIVREIAVNGTRRDWLEVPKPTNGCLVLMARLNHPAHIGTYLRIDGGNVLHADERHGVVFEDLSTLAASQWHDIKFLVHRSECRG
jgi:hypothetical protein